MLPNFEINLKKFVAKIKKLDDEAFNSLIENFFLSQGMPKVKKKKYSLILPAGNSFGSGNHESTRLAIMSLEFILKRKSFLRGMDLWTGTDIISFVLGKRTKKNIVATDYDIDVKRNFNFNEKKNELNGIFFKMLWI